MMNKILILTVCALFLSGSGLNGQKTDLAEIGIETGKGPVPAAYIISMEGVIVAVYFDTDYNKRASVKWMIQNLSTVL